MSESFEMEELPPSHCKTRTRWKNPLRNPFCQVFMALASIFCVSIAVTVFAFAHMDLSRSDMIVRDKPSPTVSRAHPTSRRPIKKTTTTTRRSKTTEYKGVGAAPVISRRDPRYTSFQQVTDILKSWMNTTVNPCDDFYHYMCGKRESNHSMIASSIQSLNNVVTKLIVKYNDDKYFENAAPPLKLVKHFYDQCAKNDSTQEEAAWIMRQRVESLKERSGVYFPMLYQNEWVEELTPTELAKLIGFTISDVGEGTLVQISVSNDWTEPDEIPVRVYVDQSLLRGATDTEMNRNLTLTMCKSVAILLGLELDERQLQNDVEELLKLEEALAEYVTDQNTRRQMSRMYNLKWLSEVQEAAPAYDWIQLLRAALSRANAEEKITEDLVVVMQEPEMMAKLSSDILDGRFKASTIANYVHFRAAFVTWTKLLEFVSQIPSVSDDARNNAITMMGGTSIITNRFKDHTSSDDSMFTLSYNCAMMIFEILTPLGDRVLIDAVYPTEESRVQLRTEVQQLSGYVIHGLRAQIDALNWMSRESKQAALYKIDHILLNIGFLDWVVDDISLIQAYENLPFSTDSSMIEVVFSLNEQTLTGSFANFRDEDVRDRSVFSSPNDIISSASYIPALNIIDIPGGALSAPMYHPNFPVAFNFGSLGVIVGHEITHGFEDEGTQFDHVGALKDWMDAESTLNFREMADCIVRQYDETCPGITGSACASGFHTQGENIADNAGLRAAYSAFKTYESLHGPDPRLPSFGKVFNNDQLFFLSFAHMWCGSGHGDELMSVFANDTHAPPIYRVQATLQNFPAFRAAFNCPVGRVYSPKDRCYVWATPPFK